LEARVGINIIDDKGATRFQSFPSQVRFEAHVAFAVDAVVNKKIDLA
jgi:hypothetical protein